MKTLLIAALAATTVAIGFQQLSLNPGANVVANRIEGSWLLDKQVTRQLDPDSSTAEMIALEFTSDPQVLRRLQNHPAASDLVKRRIFGAGQMTIGRKDPCPYLLGESDGNMMLYWFRWAEPGEEPSEKTKPSLFVDSKLVMMGVGRDSEKDMLFLGGDHVRKSSACYGRTASQ